MAVHEFVQLRDDQLEPLQLLVQIHSKPGNPSSVAKEVLQAVDDKIRVSRAKLDAQAGENETRRLAGIDAAALSYDQALTYHPDANSHEARAARERLGQ